MTLPPTKHGLSFLDSECAALARFRLGLPLDPEGGPCRHGGPGGRHPRGWFDPEGEHASSCLSNLGTRTQCYNQLRDELRRQLKWLGFLRKLNNRILDLLTGRTFAPLVSRSGTPSSRSTSPTSPNAAWMSLGPVWEPPAPPSSRPFGATVSVQITLVAHRRTPLST